MKIKNDGNSKSSYVFHGENKIIWNNKIYSFAMEYEAKII